MSDPRPTRRVLLLGWGNATPMQLALYERLYAKLGLAPTSFIPNTLVGLRSADGYARSVLPLAEEMATWREPTLVHLFSDNGFLGWAALLEALASTARGRATRDAIRGVISDSSPFLWNVRGPFDFAHRFALGMSPLATRALGREVPLTKPVLFGSFLLYQAFFPRAVARLTSGGERVARHQPRCAHLYLHGGEDEMARPYDVRAWAAEQRGLGIDAATEFFPRAGHVALFPQDPRRYRALVSEFVARVMA